MGELLRWYDREAENPPWIDVLTELRRQAAREGQCAEHVPANTIAIEQYSEKALDIRDYFFNKPYGVG